MRRGEVWWANLDPPAGARPVLLLSRDAAYERRRSVTIAPVTTRIRGLPVEVMLRPEDGLSQISVVNLDDVTTVRKIVLARRLTTLSPAKMREVEEAIRFALQLPAYRR
ncbi:MAG: type II toxin-antitoxin system PemK/MazF family toxin [Dehalococcoidia bacterium]|nr:type II toxin-antitoxin system PemK/MazF family toxin [Dehalococcoidia bacterium]